MVVLSTAYNYARWFNFNEISLVSLKNVVFAHAKKQQPGFFVIRFEVFGRQYLCTVPFVPTTYVGELVLFQISR